jgi:MFS family permease
MNESEVGRAALSKISRRFIPLLFICFVISFLDRVNVGFAALTMNRDLGLSATAFGLGAGVFFLTYFAFEVPSNLALERFGARRWIARIMFTWGILSGAMAFVQGEYSFYALRLLLGAAEAGFFPGIIFFLSIWVPAAHRAKLVALFMAAMPVASVIGAPVSSLLMQLDGTAGLRGWQWMFLIEALPALVLTPVVLRVLRDRPSDADFLTEEERGWIVVKLASEMSQRPSASHAGVGALLLNPLVLGLGLAYFGLVGFNYGLSFFLPQIVKQFGLSIVQTGFVAATPFVFASAAMIWWGRHSDRTGERRMHMVLPLCLAVIGLFGSTFAASPLMKLIFLTGAAVGTFSALPIWWTLPVSVLPATAAAAGIAIINSLGNLSGFTWPFAVGAIKDATGSFAGGLQIIAAAGLVSIVVILLVTRGSISWARLGRAAPVK